MPTRTVAEQDGEVVATVYGVVERVNKLVYVQTLRARYKHETGDIIVGRVAPKRWRLEINFSQDAVLMLSSMNLLDGVQIALTGCEHDGESTPSSKKPEVWEGNAKQSKVIWNYGCSRNISRERSIALSPALPSEEAKTAFIPSRANSKSQSSTSLEEQEQTYTPPEIRQNICRTANVVRVLSTLGFNVTVDVIMEMVKLSRSMNVDIHGDDWSRVLCVGC
ncbi:hypothetical protein LguiA_020377 [Lonicera macranthoides]